MLCIQLPISGLTNWNHLFALGVRNHLGLRSALLVISLFVLVCCIPLPTPLFLYSFTIDPFIPRSRSPLPTAMPSCKLWSQGQGGNRKWVRKLGWRLQENKAGISSRWTERRMEGGMKGREEGGKNDGGEGGTGDTNRQNTWNDKNNKTTGNRGKMWCYLFICLVSKVAQEVSHPVSWLANQYGFDRCASYLSSDDLAGYIFGLFSAAVCMRCPSHWIAHVISI